MGVKLKMGGIYLTARERERYFSAPIKSPNLLTLSNSLHKSFCFGFQ